MNSKMMKLDYEPKYLKGKLNFAVIYIVFGILSTFWGGYSFVLIFILPGIVSGIFYFYWKRKGYIKVDSTGITKYKFIPKTLNWDDLEGMRYYTDSIKLIYQNGSFDIDKQYLSDENLKRLEQEIKMKLPKN